jgi:hypothetical protein
MNGVDARRIASLNKRTPRQRGSGFREHRARRAWPQTGRHTGAALVKREVDVRLGSFAREALAREQRGRGVGDEAVSAAAVRAIRCYLEDKGAEGPGWRYPSFRRGERKNDGRVGLHLSIDEGLWQALEEEAERQGVSAQQMLEHAAIYFAAEIDAGRVTQRIIDDIDRKA